MRRPIIILLVSITCMLCACESSKEQQVFTNKHGSETTICAHEGCSNVIATSGDTLYCIEHSGKCSSCGCFVDEGETLCSECKIEILNSMELTEQDSYVAAYKTEN